MLMICKPLGTSGVRLVSTGKSIIVGLYGEGQRAGDATSAVEKVADSLIENNC
ncbi:profilin [Streptomyces sp. AB3(2024)]|uniref:profilin n=1 Tax=Streptomyces sp. AB3(2024) TaxID=3317321 RepID=UPI0035A28EA1